MKLIIDLGDRLIEESHPSEALALSHLSIVLDSHRSRGHRIAQHRERDSSYSRYLVQTPEGALQYWLEH